MANPQLNLGNETIYCDEVVKLLGVEIHFNLIFDFQHLNIIKIKNIWKKS